MAKKSLRMTEKEFSSLQNKIQITSKTNTKKEVVKKISLGLDVKEKKVNKGINVKDIIKFNKEAPFEYTVSDTHFSIIFKGARLLSINQIFATLQYKKYEIFSYKKSWHTIIKKILEDAYIELKSKKQTLPFFDDAVELTIYRQAPKLVDEDAVTTMFKYIIDAFKKDPDNNPFGILAEDNPKIVHKIAYYNEKGDYAIGIKIKLIEKNKKEPYSLEKILIK